MRFAAILGALTGLVTLSAAVEAQDRPDFQAPTFCGQVWNVSTYGPPGRNHAPDPDSLDFAIWDNGDIVVRDQPVLASAAGVIRIDRTLGNGLRYIMIDHDNNWRTHYLHIAEEEGQPRLEGRRVAMGEIIGRTSDTGSETVHIHYTQVANVALDPAALDAARFWEKMRDGDAVRAVFDGVEAKTHQADTNTWGLWGQSEAEEIRSHNCPGNRFLTWMDNGERFILRYRSETGRIRINRFDDAVGKATTRTIQRNWGPFWTSFVDFLPDGSNRRHIMGYNFASGEVNFWELAPGASNATLVGEAVIYAGWTHMEKLKIGNSDHLISYDSRYGHFNVDRFHPDFVGFVSALKTNVGAGYTQIVPYWDGNARYVLMYKGSTGAARILRLNRSGASVRVQTTWNATRAAGWTHMVALPRNGKMYVLGYRADTGAAKIWELAPNGGGLNAVRDLHWSADYTTFTPFAHNGAGHLLVQKIRNGRTKSLRLKKDLSGFKGLVTQDWQAGWR